MEFMDRRNRSLLVQFWLTVESFKNPLESIESESDNENEEPFQDPSALATVKEDVTMIRDLYFSGKNPHPDLASVPRRYIDVFQSFPFQQDPSLAEQRKVRRTMFMAQKQVERSMEQDFEEFEKSELWFRAVGDTDLGRKKISEPSPVVAAKVTKLPTSLPPASKLLQGIHQSGSTSTLGMKRTASSGSATSIQSTSSAPTARILPSNVDVFMSPTTEIAPSRPPLFDDPEDEVQRVEEQRMEAIRSALTDIIASEQDSPGNQTPDDFESSTLVQTSVSSLANRRRKPVFEDDLFGDAQEGDAETPEESSDFTKSIQVAAPGDLQLSHEIKRLGDKIANLRAQETMLDSLIRKAELTGDKPELRILGESKSSMVREIRELEFQKVQYEQQETANRLVPDKTKVTIASSSTSEEEGKSVVRYLVEIQQVGSDGSFESGWIVARRYNEFLNMHNKLRDKYALVRTLEFPGRRLVTALSTNLVDTRKAALEKYLQVNRSSS
jgi:sorting nexin-25